MYIEDAIKQLIKIREEHGNLEVFDANCNPIYEFLIHNKDDVNVDFDMPALFVQIPYMD